MLRSLNRSQLCIHLNQKIDRDLIFENLCVCVDGPAVPALQAHIAKLEHGVHFCMFRKGGGGLLVFWLL